MYSLTIIFTDKLAFFLPHHALTFVLFIDLHIQVIISMRFWFLALPVVPVSTARKTLRPKLSWQMS